MAGNTAHGASLFAFVGETDAHDGEISQAKDPINFGAGQRRPPPF
jgi:hypothetical protein